MATAIKLAPAVTRLGRPLFPLMLAFALVLPMAPALAQDQAPATTPAPAPAAPAKPKPQKPKPPVAAPDASTPAAAPKPAKPPAAAKPAATPAAAKPATTPAAAKPTTPPASTKPSAPVPAAGAQPAPGATNAGLGLGTGSGPVDVTSDESLEMQQSNKVYIARGNAIAKRGDRTLYADILMAYYRDVPNTSQTEIWRVVADGHVRITTPTQTVVGDHAIDDLDTKTDIITGKDLKLTTPTDVVTARDSLEWYEDKSVAVARGDALAIRHTLKGERRIRGDVLVSLIVQPPGEAQRISRVDATGHVVVSTPDQVGTGDKGVYNAETGIATLTHHVTLARGENTLTGEYGVIDTDKGVSRLLPRPPTEADQTRGRVNGYIIPRQKSPAGDAAKPGSGTPAKPAPDASVKAAPDAAQNVQPDATKAR
jgi:lipopolysaccharide export system protein LptA